MKQPMFHTFALRLSKFHRNDARKEGVADIFTKPLDITIKHPA
jgi:hypothetical protein